MSTSLLSDYLSPEVEEGERFEKMTRGNKEMMPVHWSRSATPRPAPGSVAAERWPKTGRLRRQAPPAFEAVLISPKTRPYPKVGEDLVNHTSPLRNPFRRFLGFPVGFTLTGGDASDQRH